MEQWYPILSFSDGMHAFLGGIFSSLLSLAVCIVAWCLCSAEYVRVSVNAFEQTFVFFAIHLLFIAGVLLHSVPITHLVSFSWDKNLDELKDW